MPVARSLQQIVVSLGFAVLAVLALSAPRAAGQGFLKRFLPVKRVAAEPGADYTLEQENGPWMVMACTFSGEGAESQCRDLVLEFRKRFNLPAYAHAMQFDLANEPVGRGIDKYGAPVRMKYRKGDRLQEWAVLVGNFPTIDDPQAQKLLQTIKTMHPDALDPETRGGDTAQSLAKARGMQRLFVSRLKESKQLGPMRTAFMARNPLLPQEYFVPKGVDKFVEKMNSGARHSLLKNTKPYTVKVATFTGETVLQGAKNAPTRGANELSPLEEAAFNAEQLAGAMREAGWEAYEFHDRHESIVTVGGFDEENPQQTSQEVMRIFRTFGAQFNTPEDPLQHAKLDHVVQTQTEQRLKQFNRRFNSPHATVTGGMKPKFARIPPKSKNARVIPFDIYPEVIEVPQKTISSGFAWRN